MAKIKKYPTTINENESKFIKDFLLNNKNVLKSTATRHIPEKLRYEIINKAKSLGLLNTQNFNECLYWVYNNLSAYPKKCVSCGSDVKTFHSFAWGYPHLRCSGKCANNDVSVKDKKAQKSIIKYGTEFPVQSQLVKNKARSTFIDGWFEQRFNKFIPEYTPITTQEEYSSAKTKFIWQHKCGHVFSEYMGRADTKPICPACRTDYRISRGQRDITELINAILPHEIIIQNDRRSIYPLELDIYLPNLNIAFEYNGDYWHSYNRIETTEEQLKHFNKYMVCKEHGIRLVQIREEFWEKNKNSCIDFIKNILCNNEIIELGDREITVPLNHGIDFIYENNDYIIKQYNLPNYTYIPSVNEEENINYFELGYRRLWDAGSATMVKK